MVIRMKGISSTERDKGTASTLGSTITAFTMESGNLNNISLLFTQLI